MNEAARELVAAALANPALRTPNADEMAANVLWSLEQGEQFVVPKELLESLVCEDDDCSFDHHGGCDAHGFSGLKPGEVCPQEGIKRILGWRNGG